MTRRVIDELKFLDRVFLAILPVMLQNEERWGKDGTNSLIHTAWRFAEEALKQRSLLHDAAADKELEDGYRAMAADEGREKENPPDEGELLVEDYMKKAG